MLQLCRGDSRIKRSNVDWLDQSAASRISDMETPVSAAADVAASLVECALKMVVHVSTCVYPTLKPLS